MKLILLAAMACASSAAGAALPSQLVIEHHLWRVVEVKTLKIDSDKLDGFTNCLARQITIRKQDVAGQAETLVHEIFHAVGCEHGQLRNELWNNSAGESHPGIYRMSPRVYRVLVNNPDLLRFIRESAEPEEVREPQ